MTCDEIYQSYIDCACPGLTGYAYQATTWCEECGQAIMRDLVAEWEKSGKLASITHDDLCDTEQFPMPIVFEECDYCDECGNLNEDDESEEE